MSTSPFFRMVVPPNCSIIRRRRRVIIQMESYRCGGLIAHRQRRKLIYARIHSRELCFRCARSRVSFLWRGARNNADARIHLRLIAVSPCSSRYKNAPSALVCAVCIRAPAFFLVSEVKLRASRSLSLTLSLYIPIHIHTLTHLHCLSALV